MQNPIKDHNDYYKEKHNYKLILKIKAKFQKPKHNSQKNETK